MNNFLNKYFQLKENGTDVKTEFLAGLTTFITMAYIIVVNPSILSITGMDKGAIFVATIISTVIATLIMGLYANVPFAQAPGMGLNAFFTFTVVLVMGFSWQQALAVVFLCGILNFIIVITNVRKMLINAIPESLQYAISGGIGLFIAYIGIKNGHLLNFITEGYDILFSAMKDGKISEVVSKNALPTLVNFQDPVSVLSLLGILITAVLMLRNVKGAILIGIVVTTVIGIFNGVTQMPVFTAESFFPPSLSPTLFKLDIMGLFAPDKIFTVLSLIFAFSLSDTFDTIGTFIGTGRKAGIFDKKDTDSLHESKGMSSKMDRALFADGIATSIGAMLGTSNVTSYVESASGISVGGKTGLTSVFTALFFFLALFISPLALMIPSAATAAALIVVGILMMESMSKVKWDNFEEAVSAFFTCVMMPFSYSISNGIAAGFIFYVLAKVVKGHAKEVHPLMYIVTALFILNFLINAL